MIEGFFSKHCVRCKELRLELEHFNNKKEKKKQFKLFILVCILNIHLHRTIYSLDTKSIVKMQAQA